MEEEALIVTKVHIVVKPWYKRLIGLPNMWKKQWKLMRGVSLRTRISWCWECTKIVMKRKTTKK